jgi:DNA-binding MarR family transcriptional regulator
MQSVRQVFQTLERHFGLLDASCCDECCGRQVSMVQCHILFEIRRRGSPSMQQVAEELGLDVTTFSRQAKNLVQKGLIVRRTSHDDRRVCLLGVTDEGNEVLEQVDHYMADKLERIFSAMTPFERKTVAKSLALLNEALLKSNYHPRQNRPPSSSFTKGTRGKATFRTMEAEPAMPHDGNLFPR